jgi:hypothetical protein
LHSASQLPPRSDFLDAKVPAPLDVDDDLTRHLVGRPQDMTADEEPWVFEGSVYVTPDNLVSLGAGALELHVIVNIPIADLPEVVRRLGIHGTSDKTLGG